MKQMRRTVGQNQGYDVIIERNEHETFPSGCKLTLFRGNVIRVDVAFVDNELADELEGVLERMGMQTDEPTTVIE